MEHTESIVEGRASLSSEALKRPVRLRFAAEYKAKILAEADVRTETRDLGALPSDCDGNP